MLQFGYSNGWPWNSALNPINYQLSVPLPFLVDLQFYFFLRLLIYIYFLNS